MASMQSVLLMTAWKMVPLLLILLVPVSPTCLNGATLLQRSKLSCGNKQYIVDYHNKIRNYVASGSIESQPKAANMIQLRWREDLANLAQKRADTCLFEHGDLELKGERVGQNLAIVYNSAKELQLNITYMMELWYKEVFQYGYTQGFEPNSGHYSQLIWGTTKEVGCGYTFFKEDRWYKMYLVCNYFPPGNWIGEKPYVYGKRNCKEYGLQESLRYNKLCAVANKDTKVCKVERLQNETDASNYSSGEESAVEDSSMDASNESAQESGERPNGEDEVVTANYEQLDESAELTTPKVSIFCNDSSSMECLQHVAPDEVTNSASVESVEAHCSQMATIYKRAEDEIRRIHSNLEVLMNIFTVSKTNPERQIVQDSSWNETLEESRKPRILSEDGGNYTLHVIEESFQLTTNLLKTFTNNTS